MSEGQTGKAAEHDADAVDAAVRQTLARLSQTGALPSLPAVATVALGICRHPDGDLSDLTRVLQTDVGLTARLVRAANSPLYGRRRRAASVQDAVVTVGLRQICDILVAVCAKQLYTGSGRYTDLLWNHALATAVAAEVLARRTGGAKAGAAFLPGLLHDIGRIALELADARIFALAQARIESGEGRNTVIEREWFRFDHAQAGAILAEDWGLAASQCAAIRWHHEPSSAPPGMDLARLVNGADHLAYIMGFGSSTAAPAGIDLAALGLSPEELPSLAEEGRASFEEHVRLLG